MGRYRLLIAALTLLWVPATMATITIIFYPAENGSTMAMFQGSGVKKSPGGSNSINWANLTGGDPFDSSLNSAQFPLPVSLSFSENANIIALDLDSDGTGDDQDDFTIRFDGLFSFEDVYTINQASEIVGLNFALLTPGVYTRSDNTVGGLTLIVSGTPPVDSDNDGVTDGADNCLAASNPSQRDTDGDLIGNVCDADFNQDCTVNFLDLSIFGSNFLANGDLDTDLNGDGLSNFADLAILSQQFFMPPGPSGFATLCD